MLELGPIDQLAEAGRGQHHGDEVDLRRGVLGHELRGQGAAGGGQMHTQRRQPRAGGLELGPGPGQAREPGVELSLGRHLSVREDRDLGAELGDEPAQPSRARGQGPFPPGLAGHLLAQGADAGCPGRRQR